MYDKFSFEPILHNSELVWACAIIIDSSDFISSGAYVCASVYEFVYIVFVGLCLYVCWCTCVGVGEGKGGWLKIFKTPKQLLRFDSTYLT